MSVTPIIQDSPGKEAVSASAPPRPSARITLSPPPTAMAWMKVGVPHELMAVPEVCLAPGDALVEIEFATVCGSDLHTVSGRRSAPVPLVLGHEQVGRVVALGDGAVRTDGTPLRVGERVIWSIMVSCAECDRCLRSLPQKCRTLAKYGHEQVRHGWELSGGFASHAHLRAGTAIVPVAESMPREIAAPLSCASATAMAAVEAAAAVTELKGANVLVTGAGLVGLTVTAIAADRGARVIVSDPDPQRRATALRFGAVAAVDPLLPAGSPTALPAVLTSLSLDDGLDVAIEASGSAPAVAQAIACLDIGGVAVLVGSVHPVGRVPMDPEAMVRGLKTIRGVHNYTPRHLADAVAYLEERHNAYPFAMLVSTTFPLSELDAAIAEAATGGHVRVGIIP
ncbi:putative phosphonate catabolism associated alcohol dehydrogenase [Arthrobacter alpinus]|uniref:alcohol dehydrogenase n=1 Tax=Arthrobacter alpinus TaxID=656366 RepID=A0A1H5ISV6_9MICC|nr:zinc-binding dehydrogenase [Arthrobacter alpinus]SEE42548.1 putative phosphonate catabolism associated alcohol dehydrogenase [Arthrobacter alpinus]